MTRAALVIPLLLAMQVVTYELTRRHDSTVIDDVIVEPVVGDVLGECYIADREVFCEALRKAHELGTGVDTEEQRMKVFAEYWKAKRPDVFEPVLVEVGKAIDEGKEDELAARLERGAQ